MFLRIALFCVVTGVSLAQPTVVAIANAASFAGEIAPGSIVTIFGSNLAASTDQAETFPLPTTLGGASVMINSLPCPMLFASTNQINLQIPYEASTGSAMMLVSNGSTATSPIPLILSASAPGIFQASAGRAAANNSDGTLNTASNPAAVNSVISVFFTGQGPVSPAGITGGQTPSSSLTSATLSFSATIGGVNATVQFLGLAPEETSGLAQANIVVPSIVSGDYPLIITVGGVSSVSATVSVRSSGPATTSVLTLQGSVRLPNPPVQALVGGLVGVGVLGNFAYVCTPSQITIINISNVTAPSVVGTFGQSDLANSGTTCQVAGNVLLEVISAARFVVYSLANQTSPSRVSPSVTLQFPFTAFVTISGTTAFFTTNHFTFVTTTRQLLSQGGEVQAYDLTNVASPVFLSTLPPATAIPGNDNNSPRFQPWIFPTGIGAFLGTTSNGSNSNSGIGQFALVSVATPSAMASLGQIQIQTSVILTGIGLSNNLGLIVGNTQSYSNPGIVDPVTGVAAFPFTGNLTLNLADFTTTTNPLLLSTTGTTVQTTNLGSVAGLGGNFFAIGYGPPLTDLHGPSTLALVNASNTSQVSFSPVAAIQGDQISMVVGGNFLFVATGTQLNIYRIAIP